MIRYFDGEFSTFEEYLREIWRVQYRNKHDDNISKNKNDGGFLVPEYMSNDKPGLHAWILRFIGRLLNRHDIYSKGVEMVNFYELLTDGKPRIRKCEIKIS